MLSCPTASGKPQAGNKVMRSATPPPPAIRAGPPIRFSRCSNTPYKKKITFLNTTKELTLKIPESGCRIDPMI
jgi:hypothetical protein